MSVAADIGDDRHRARCLTLLAYASFYSDFTAADELLKQACQYGRQADDLLAVDLALTIEANLRLLQERYAEAHRLAEQLYERVAPRGVRFSAAFAREPQAYVALFTGDVRRAVALATEARDIAAPLGDYFTVCHTTNNLAWITCLSGDAEGARRIIEPVARSTEAAGLVEASWLALAMGTVHLADGEFESAITWLRRAAAFDAPTDENWVTARVLPGLAHALRMAGQRDQALQTASRALAISRKLGTPHLVAAALEQLAFLAEPDDPGQAENLHHQALAVRVRHGLRTFWADSLDALAGLAVTAGSSAEATRLLAASDAARESTGYPRPRSSRASHDARVNKIHDTLGDEAFAEAWAAGGRLSPDEAVDYATRGRGSRGRPATGWTSLTRTELEIVRLVAEGLSNPEIGARLFMSRATVKTHLSHVYAKLSVANRTELAALAATRPPRGEHGQSG